MNVTDLPAENLTSAPCFFLSDSFSHFIDLFLPPNAKAVKVAVTLNLTTEHHVDSMERLASKQAAKMRSSCAIR